MADESSLSDSYIRVACAEDTAFVQVFGLASMFLAPTLQAFVESEKNDGIVNFVIDMKYCQGMDSTFMGTLIGLSTVVKNLFGWFCLVNVSDDNRRLLKMLGVIHMISIREAPLPITEGEFTTLYPSSDPVERQKQIRNAHLALIEADPGNKQRFGPFIEALEEELSSLPRIVPPKSKSQDDAGGPAK
ncbi:MAG: STAS domain-containing protein [Planctomycetota bacterium]|jgi:anti-anti-sigma factor|nr:STAS domain-containing protein [Planctomycetota bacterium]